MNKFRDIIEKMSRFRREETHAPPEAEKTKKKILSLPSLSFVFLIILAGALTFLVSRSPAASGWQAVFLNNDQVYFGRVKDVGGGYIALDNVFYLRANQLIQTEGVLAPELNLVKLGSELHGPEDRMYISKNNILFLETLKDDSLIVRSIMNFISSQ